MEVIINDTITKTVEDTAIVILNEDRFSKRVSTDTAKVAVEDSYAVIPSSAVKELTFDVPPSLQGIITDVSTLRSDLTDLIGEQVAGKLDISSYDAIFDSTGAILDQYLTTIDGAWLQNQGVNGLALAADIANFAISTDGGTTTVSVQQLKDQVAQLGENYASYTENILTVANDMYTSAGKVETLTASYEGTTAAIVSNDGIFVGFDAPDRTGEYFPETDPFYTSGNPNIGDKCSQNGVTYKYIGGTFGPYSNGWVKSVAPKEPVVFTTKFKDGVTGWTNYIGGGEISVVNTDQLQVGNNSGNDQAWLIHDKSFVYDPTKTYKFRFRVKRTAGTTNICYLGFAGRDSAGNLVNVTGLNDYGSQHYIAAVNKIPALDEWVEYVGYTSGVSGTAGNEHPNPFQPATAYTTVTHFSPLILVNYNQQAGTYIIDEVTVSEVNTADIEWVGGASKLIAGPNGEITGWEFANGSSSPSGSEFVIHADNFRIRNTNDAGGIPFSVSGSNVSFNGVVTFSGALNSNVYIDSNGNLQGGGSSTQVAIKATVDDIISDNILSANEKPAIRLEWERINNEKTSAAVRATNLNLTGNTVYTDYIATFQSLSTYLNNGVTYTSGIPSWISDANLSTNTAINGSVFRTNFNNYYEDVNKLITLFTDTVGANAEDQIPGVDDIQDRIPTSTDKANKNKGHILRQRIPLSSGVNGNTKSFLAVGGSTYNYQNWVLVDVTGVTTDCTFYNGTDGPNEAYKSGSIHYGWKPMGGTIIDGGNIITGSINADHIKTNSLTATEINVDDLFAQNITAEGVVTGGTFKGGNYLVVNSYSKPCYPYFTVIEDDDTSWTNDNIINMRFYSPNSNSSSYLRPSGTNSVLKVTGSKYQGFPSTSGVLDSNPTDETVRLFTKICSLSNCSFNGSIKLSFRVGTTVIASSTLITRPDVNNFTVFTVSGIRFCYLYYDLGVGEIYMEETSNSIYSLTSSASSSLLQIYLERATDTAVTFWAAKTTFSINNLQ